MLWQSVVVIFIVVLLQHLLVPPGINLLSYLSTGSLQSSFRNSNIENIGGLRVVITGASFGIGKSLALEVAASHAKSVVVAARSLQRLQAVREEIEQRFPGTKVFPVQADLSTKEACETLIRQSIDLMGGIDVLLLNHITNSRFGLWSKAEENYPNDDRMLEDMFTVNTFSYIWLTQAALPSLQANSGRIGVVSSLAAQVGMPFTALYSASKHALQGFFDSLRMELMMMKNSESLVDGKQSSFDVSITICAIGATDTEGAATVKTQLSTVKFDPPEEAALAIVYGVGRRRRDVYHPQHLVYPVVFLERLWPRLVDYILVHELSKK